MKNNAFINLTDLKDIAVCSIDLQLIFYMLQCENNRECEIE